MNEKQITLIQRCIKDCKDRLILFAGKNKTLLEKGYNQRQADDDRKVIDHFESMIKINVSKKWKLNINITIWS